MKKVLFVANHLTVGGVQKSLISALDSIEYSTNDVTLYIRKNRLDLLPYINKNVKVIINDEKKHFYLLPKAIILQLFIKINKILKRKACAEKCKMLLSDYIRVVSSEYESAKYFREKEYDVAISYWQGYNTLFVDKYVKAKRKIMFYQVSTDELHNVHQEVMPNYDQIVVEHDDIKNSLYSWYKGIDNKVFVLENFTDPQLLKKMCNEKHIEKPEDNVTICTCARFSKVKGIDLAVETARLLKEKNIKFVWYLVGDGPLFNDISAKIKEYQLEECVILTGMQKNPYPYMQVSDIYVQPSYEEALSIAMLESQVLCVPMVSTKTAGGIAMVKDGINGYLSDINADALSAAIEKLISDCEKRNEMKDYLLNIDYSAEKERYMNGWKKLLEA